MLGRKIIRDICKNKVQFLAIFIMLFVGVFIFAGISSEWYGLSYYSEQYINESHFADAFVYVENSNISDVQALLQNKNIQEVETRTLLDTTLNQNTKKKIALHVTKSNQIAKLHVVSGVAFSNQMDGIWLDANFAKANHLQVGDILSLKQQQMVIEKNIVGLVYSPEYIYGANETQITPNYKNYGFAFTNTKYFPDSSMLLENQLLVRAKGRQIKQDIEQTLKDKKVEVILKKDHPALSMIKDEIAQHQSMGNIFSFAFLVIAMLITIITMHRMLQSQRMQIGILKALGFSNQKLLFHFICHSSLICLLGTTLGYICGSLFLPNIIYPFMKELYVLPALQSRFVPYGWLLPIACFILCVCISMHICRSYIKEKAATILQGNKTYNAILVSPNLFTYLPFRYQWNIRDIIRNRLRAIMTIMGVMGCTALLLCSFGLFDTMTRVSSFAFEDLQQYECKVVVNAKQQENIQVLKKNMNGQEIMEGNITIKYKDRQKEGTITVIEDTQRFKLATSLNTYASLNEGVALSYTIAKKWDIQVGDTIAYRLYASDTWQEEKVTSIVRTPMNQGITILKQEYLASNKPYLPTALIGNNPHLDHGENTAIQSIFEKEQLQQDMNTMLDGLVMMIVILVLGAIVLGSVVLYNLGVLSYLERYHELATLKVLGLQDKAIKKILIQQNIWLAFIGIVLGLFAGYGLLVYMMTTLPDAMDVVMVVKPVSYIYASLGTLMLSWLISYFLSRKIKYIDMVVALKSNE